MDVGHANAHGCFLTWLVLRSAGDDLEVQDPFLGRDNNLLGLLVDLAVTDRDRFDKEIGHIFLADGDLLDRALAVHLHDKGLEIDTIGRPHEQKHGTVRPVGVDLQVHRLTRLVLLLVGDQFQVIETELAAVKTLPDNREDIPSLDRMSLAVGQFQREPVLPWCRGGDLLFCFPVGAGFQVPLTDDRLHRLIAAIISDPQQLQQTLALDRLLVERLCLEMCLDRLPHLVVTAVDPAEDFERLLGNQDATLADDRPP